MSTRSERDRQKALQEKHQNVLQQLLKDEDNKYCVDCDAKGPRWASWNLGIFLCIRCAGIHRNLGVHISKVKSVNLDTWTPEQIAMVQEMGNSRARAVYEANIPDSFRRPQTDSGLEAFIRAKYEHKKYIAHEWVPPQPKAQPIFEEMPKKEKKKSRPRQEGLQISAPPSSSVPTSKPQTSSKAETEESASASRPRKPPAAPVDLLGLDDPPASTLPTAASDSGDLFGEFMSTPVSTNSTNSTTSTSNPAVPSSQADLMPTMLQNGDVGQNHLPAATTVPGNNTVLENGETSLLGETSAAGTEQKKSKESILALYGNSATSQPQNMYGMAGGMYMPPGGATQQQPQMDMSHNNQMYNMAGMVQPSLQQQQQQHHHPNAAAGGMMNMQAAGMHHPQQQQQGVPAWNANTQFQYTQGTGGMMGGMGGLTTGMTTTGMPQNMMMSNQGMYNTNMYTQGQQMTQIQNQMTGMNLGMAAQNMGAYQQQPAAMATVGGGGGGVGGVGGGWGVPQTGNTLATNLWQ